MFLQKNNNRKKNRDVDFDEILMDARNIPEYHRESFEGAFERPIKKFVHSYILAAGLRSAGVRIQI